MPANAMLVFQEIRFFLFCVGLLEEGKNTAFAPGNSAARSKGGVNFILGDVLRTGRDFHLLRRKSPAGQIQILKVLQQLVQFVVMEPQQPPILLIVMVELLELCRQYRPEL